MTTFLLVRHGETDWNRESRFQGHADPPLNARGRDQAHALADTVAGEAIAAVYASPLRRALETAEILAQRLRVPVEPVDGLREVDVGEWQGLTREEIEQRFPDAYARWLAFGRGWEDGETYEEMGRRVVAALHELAARHRDETVLVVTHGGPLRAAEARASRITHAEARRLGRPLGNCDVARIAVQDGELRRLD